MAWEDTGKMVNTQQDSRRSRIAPARRWMAIVGLSCLLGNTGAIAAELTIPGTPSTPSPTPLESPSSDLAPVIMPTPTPSPLAKPKPQAKPQPQEQVDEFPPNPLESTEPEPLLPSVSRPLTALEQRQLRESCDRFNAIAASKFNAGDKIGAYEVWNRELRLRRALGLLEELPALARVGDIAWQDNNSTQLHWITQRLDAVQATLPVAESREGSSSQARLDRPDVVENLAFAYQQVRLPKIAANLYRQVLADARQRRDEFKVETTLNTLAQLYMAWFNYGDASQAYRELLQITRAKPWDAVAVAIPPDQTLVPLTSDTPSGPVPLPPRTVAEIYYLMQLAYVHEQAKQPEQAIPYQQALVELYQNLADPVPVPSLKIKIADNYAQMGRLDLAEHHYQVAQQLADPLKQLDNSAVALRKLGQLYLAHDRLEAAIRVYNYLIYAEQQSYNYYGVMDAFDQLGQIYLKQENLPLAISAFTKGLDVAQRLKYRQDYFTQQLAKIPKP